MNRTCTFRQILIQCSLVITGISEGMLIGQLSGMIAALQSEDNDVRFSDDVISWIASVLGGTTAIGMGLAAIISNKFGRKPSMVILTVPLIFTWIMQYYATAAAEFIASRALAGIFSGGVILILFASTAEYSSPNVRAFCLFLVTSVAQFSGTALGHILSILFHWRKVVLMAIVPTALSAILPFFWVESPSWLASKGRFEECEMAFKALHGNTINNNAELKLLIDAEKCKKVTKVKSTNRAIYTIRKFLNLLREKSFWNLFLLNMAITVYNTAAGKYLFSTFAITMLRDLTGSEDVLLFTLLVDGFFILGSCLSCILIRQMKLRTLFFSTGIVSNMLLIIFSICIFFNEEQSNYYAWVKTILLSTYLITANAGPFPVLDGLFGEMFPLEFRSCYIFLFGAISMFAVFLNLIIALNMFSTMGYHGVFLLNALLVGVAQLYLWFRLPETKGRTLQEIEMFFGDNRFERNIPILKEISSKQGLYNKTSNEFVLVNGRGQDEASQINI